MAPNAWSTAELLPWALPVPQRLMSTPTQPVLPLHGGLRHVLRLLEVHQKTSARMTRLVANLCGYSVHMAIAGRQLYSAAPGRLTQM